jgi:uncharacterized protein YegL
MARKTAFLAVAVAAAMLTFGLGGLARASVLVTGETDSGVNLLKLQAHAAVHGRGAQTVLNLTFTNHGAARNAQATVLFPVPEGAAVQRLRLKIGDTWMEGEVTGRVQGKAVYENLRRVRVDPALLAQAGEDLYRLRVFPIPTGGTTEVEIVYWHVLPEDDGRLCYELPFDIAGSTASPVRTSVALNLYAGGLGKVSAKVPADWPDARAKVAGGSLTVTCPERAMELSGSVRVILVPKDRPELLLARRSGGGEGSFFLQVRPEAPAGRKAAPRRFVFCLDRSGSMQGEKITQAREALASCLSALRDADSFNVVIFSSTVETFTKKMEPAAEMRKSALKFVAGIEANGSTDIRGALLAALELDTEGREPLDVIMISDGQQTIGASTAEAVLGPIKDAAAARKAPVRITAVGIGSDVDSALLRRMAEGYEGEAAFVTTDHAVAGQIDAVLARLQSLRMERLTVEVEGAGAELATPGYFPAALYDQAVTVAGTYREAGKLRVKLAWQEGASKRSWQETYSLPAERDDYQGVPILLGAACVDALEAEITRSAREEPGLAKIVAAGHVYRLVTRYTSLIALENDGLYAQQGVARPERDPLGIARKVAPTNLEIEKRFAPTTTPEPSRPVAAVTPAPQPAPTVIRPPDVVAVAPAPRQQPPDYDPTKKRDLFKSTRDVQADTQVEHPVVIHERPSDHFETDNTMDKNTSRGSADAVSDMPLGGTGTVGSIGVGGGGMAGVFGFRDGGGRKKAVGRFGGSQATEESVEAALQWLARHQEADGSWDAKKLGAAVDCRGEATGLAALAFLGAGYTQKAGRYADNVSRALDWIAARQDAEGGFKLPGAEPRRTQAVLTLALSEAYGMERSEPVGKAAQKAADRCLQFRKQYSGWGRGEGAEPDTLTTAWFVAALKSARIAGLKVDGAGLQGAAAFLDSVKSADGQGLAAQPGAKAPDPASSMAGSAALILLGGLRGQAMPAVRWAAENAGTKPGPEHLYFGTLVCFQVGGDEWRTWNETMKKALLGSQARGGSPDGSEKDTDGSWPAEGAAAAGGRVLATAMSALTLEVYYRYLPMYVR